MERLLKTGKFSCPICSQLYQGQIFQCVNGHSICQDCVQEKKSFCEKCNFTSLIRNLALEDIMDLLEFKCENSGCPVNLTRHNVHMHRTTECCYRIRSMNICQVLGIGNCTFEVLIPLKKIGELVEHMKSNHGLVVSSTLEADTQTPRKIILEDFGNVSVVKKMWNPVLVDFRDSEDDGLPAFMVYVQEHKKQGSLSWNIIWLKSPTSYSDANCILEIKLQGRISVCIWRGNAVKLDVFNQQDPSIFPFVLPIETVKKYYTTKNDLSFEVKITTEEDLNENGIIDLGEALEIKTRQIELESEESPRQNTNNIEISEKQQMLIKSSAVIFHENGCDNCYASPLIDVLFRCLRCPNYVLCDACMSKRAHKQHVFAKIHDIQEKRLMDTFIKKSRSKTKRKDEGCSPLSRSKSYANLAAAEEINNENESLEVSALPINSEDQAKLEIQPPTCDKDEVEQIDDTFVTSTKTTILEPSARDNLTDQARSDEQTQPLLQSSLPNADSAYVNGSFIDVVGDGDVTVVKACKNCEDSSSNNYFHCLFCSDYNICETCHGNRVHKKPHIFALLQNTQHWQLIYKWPQPVIDESMCQERFQKMFKTDECVDQVHREANCSNCCTKIIGGRQYRCLQCNAFVLCNNCIHQVHSHHIFASISKAKQSGLLRSWEAIRAPDPILDNSVITGPDKQTDTN